MPIHREVPAVTGSVTDPISSIAQFVVLTAEAGDQMSLVARRMRLFDCGALLIEMDDGSKRILSERDVLRAVADSRQHRSVGSLATVDPIDVDGSDDIGVAASVMLEAGVRHLIVNDGDRVGIVSIRDVVGPLLNSATGEVDFSTS